MSQMKIHWVRLIADRLDSVKEKKISEREDIAIETIQMKHRQKKRL